MPKRLISRKITSKKEQKNSCIRRYSSTLIKQPVDKVYWPVLWKTCFPKTKVDIKLNSMFVFAA